MATLAKELAARGKVLKDPYKDHNEKAQAAGLPFEDLEEAEDHNYSDDESVSDIEESESSEEEPRVSFSPPPRTPTATKMPPKKAASPAISSAMKHKAPRSKHAVITGLLGAPISNGIAAPIIKGEFMSRCIKTRKRFNHYHIRMLSHNYVTADDILYEWIDKNTLKVVVYDPPWWSDPEYQAAFDAVHGKGSNLIESMIDFQEERKEKVPGVDEKRTGNTGYFTFGEPMSIKEEDDTVVVPQKILHNGIDGLFIVIKVRVAPTEKEEESTPRKAKSGSAKAAAVGTGKNFKNVRQRDDDEDKDEDMGVAGGEAKKPTKQYTKSAPSQPPVSQPHLHVPDPQANSQLAAKDVSDEDEDVSNSNSDGDWSNDSIQVDEQEPVSSLQVAAKDWKKEEIDGLPDGEEEVDDNKDLPEGY